MASRLISKSRDTTRWRSGKRIAAVHELAARTSRWTTGGVFFQMLSSFFFKANLARPQAQPLFFNLVGFLSKRLPFFFCLWAVDCSSFVGNSSKAVGLFSGFQRFSFWWACRGSSDCYLDVLWISAACVGPVWAGHAVRETHDPSARLPSFSFFILFFSLPPASRICLGVVGSVCRRLILAGLLFLPNHPSTVGFFFLFAFRALVCFPGANSAEIYIVALSIVSH